MAGSFFTKDDSKPYKAPRDWYPFWMGVKAVSLGLVFVAFVGGVVLLNQHNDHNARVKFSRTCQSLKGTMFVTDDAFQCVVGKTMISQDR